MIKLPKGARVCFVGDSITANNDYILYIQNHFFKNRKNEGIKFYNCGVSGGGCWSQLQFFENDTARHKPTHIFIMLGVNDSGFGYLEKTRSAERYLSLTERYERFKVNLEKLYNEAKGTGAKIVFMTPPPYDEFAQIDTPAIHGAYALILGYADYVKQFAKAHGCEFIDVNRYLTEKMQSENLYNPDRVHPTRKGQFYIAECIIDSMGETPKEFAEIPEYLHELNDTVQKIRAIYFTELIIIGIHNLTVYEKYEKVKAYLEQPTPTYVKQAEIYLREKENEEKLYSEVENILERLYLYDI